MSGRGLVRVMLCVGLLVTAPLSALAAGASSDSSAVLGFNAGELTDSAVFGRWQDGAARGEFRVVVTKSAETPSHARLFLQWLPSSSNGEVKPLYTVAVDEINRPAVYRFRSIAYREYGDQQYLLCLVENQYNHQSEQLMVALKPAGQYDFLGSEDGKQLLAEQAPVHAVRPVPAITPIDASEAAKARKDKWATLLNFATF